MLASELRKNVVEGHRADPVVWVAEQMDTGQPDLARLRWTIFPPALDWRDRSGNSSLSLDRPENLLL
jgi:hypothetical protein